MGRVKEVLAELDNGAEVVVTQWGVTFSSETLTKPTEPLRTPWNYHLTVNDIDSIKQMLDYLRQMRPFETLAEITGSHPQIDFPDLKTLPEAPAVGTRKAK